MEAVTVTQVSPRNLMYTYNLGPWNLNLHLILGEHRSYVVDTGLGSETVAPILKELESRDKPVVVINTHFHWDHIWGNFCFPDSPVISHVLCREQADNLWDEMLQKNGGYIRGEVQKRLPDLVFTDSLSFPDDGIRLFYTPGHTVDGISVYDERDRVLNAGDNIGDEPDDIVPGLNEPEAVYRKTLEQYMALDVAACISGHNAVQGGDIFRRILAELDKATE
ncbi:MAG: MBL fold metallo-hydrolase [Oscillospiraceae bacterium]